VWRETLLAKKVLEGRTRGYRHHPQLERFRARSKPVGAVSAYLRAVLAESRARGYSFNARLAGRGKAAGRIPVTRGQIKYEFGWLCRKLKQRDPKRYARVRRTKNPRPHPLFRIVPGPVESWEKVAPTRRSTPGAHLRRLGVARSG